VQRFEFRLERVLNLKKQWERMAELRQQQARIALDAARSVVTALQEQIAHNAATFEARLGCSEDGDSWLVRYQQSARLGDRLELAEAKAQVAESKYQEASTARTKMATEVEALLFLRRQKWHAFRLEVQRAQQEHLDEVGMRRWRAARQDKQHISEVVSPS
jgi:flagellar biosynthesis chaperone FliJ